MAKAGMAENERLAEAEADGLPRGTNQSGMRALNERLVLTLLRRHGALAKSDLARMTGLSAQTVSVIMRALERDGLLARGTPQRGRVGQPSVPMSLAAEGAFFFGLKLGRRSVELVLVDFLGGIRGLRRQGYRYPTPDAVLDFVAGAVPALRGLLPDALQARISGMGVAMPFQLWSWVALIGAPQGEMDGWRLRDLAAELATLTGMAVHVQNDASSACRAELIFGNAASGQSGGQGGGQDKDFLYFYFGTLIGGGLVINGRLFLGRSGNAAGIGPMQVPGRDGRMRRLLEVASLSVLAEAMEAAGAPSDHIWESPEDWVVPGAVQRDWVAATAEGLASAILSAAALVEIEAVVIDGWMPSALRAEVVRQTQAALLAMDLSGIDGPQIRAGSIGPDARALGAAAIPLAQRYLFEPDA